MVREKLGPRPLLLSLALCWNNSDGGCSLPNPVSLHKLSNYFFQIRLKIGDREDLAGFFKIIFTPSLMSYEGHTKIISILPRGHQYSSRPPSSAI